MCRIFSVKFGSLDIFFNAHTDDYFLVAQICEAHFNEKMGMNCFVTRETVVFCRWQHKTEKMWHHTSC